MYRLIHEEDNFLIIDKAMIMPTIRQADSAGLSDDVALSYPELNAIKDFGFTHRLDNETLGLVIVARNKNYYEAVRAMFSEHKIQKKYHARVLGRLPEQTGSIYYPIAHSKSSDKKMVAVKPGYRVYRGEPRSAQTDFKVIAEHAETTDLELSTVTGLRHQIRVHLQSIGYSICGDRLYSKDTNNNSYPSLMLVAKHISFICPITSKTYNFISTVSLDNMFNELK